MSDLIRFFLTFSVFIFLQILFFFAQVLSKWHDNICAVSRDNYKSLCFFIVCNCRRTQTFGGKLGTGRNLCRRKRICTTFKFQIKCFSCITTVKVRGWPNIGYATLKTRVLQSCMYHQFNGFFLLLLLCWHLCETIKYRFFFICLIVFFLLA